MRPSWWHGSFNLHSRVYQSFAETMQMVSFRIILGIKAVYYRLLLEFESDLSNAFQKGGTDRPGQDYPSSPLLLSSSRF